MNSAGYWNVGDLKAALTNVPDDIEIAIGFEGTSGPLLDASVGTNSAGETEFLVATW